MDTRVIRIIEIAKEKGISHAHLARKMGTYRTRLSECRNGKSSLSDSEIIVCADELCVPVEYLYGEEPATQSEQPVSRRESLMIEARRELADLPDDELERALGVLRALKKK